MSTHQHEFSIQGMCRVLGVSPSGYYAWRAQGGQKQTARQDAILTEQIRRVFDQSGQTYGSPRVYAELRRKASPVVVAE